MQLRQNEYEQEKFMFEHMSSEWGIVMNITCEYGPIEQYRNLCICLIGRLSNTGVSTAFLRMWQASIIQYKKLGT